LFNLPLRLGHNYCRLHIDSVWLPSEHVDQQPQHHGDHRRSD
jgi:hypothetical protein